MRYRVSRGVFFLFTVLLAFSLFPASSVTAADAGTFPFFPSLLNTSTGGPIAGDEFEPPTRCRGCHREIFDQWSGSMHSNALVDPIFQALWKIGAKETKGEIDNLCLGCHTAIGVVTEEISIDLETMELTVSDIAAQGVQCDFCHTVKEMTLLATPTLDPQNASITVEPGEVKRGPYDDSRSPGHETAYSELHTRSEFCGACHNVFHPATYFPIERTYEEWKESVYARAGIQCQDCHMMPVAVAAETARTMKKGSNPGKASPMGPQRDQVYTHEFVGANFTVPALLGAEKHAGIAVERLRTAAELSLGTPGSASKGAVATVSVTVRNVGAGHNLPTSLTDVRQMWLDISVKDAGGREIFRSGSLNEQGDIDPNAAIFRASAVDDQGHHTVKPWEISHFEYVTTIPPKGATTERYTFLVPADAASPLGVSATLRYRSYSQAVANLLLGAEAPTLPVVDMAVAEATLTLN